MNPLLAPLLALLSFLFASTLDAKPLQVSLEVDARDVSRKLLHSKMTFDVNSGELILRYPEWIPGVHAPRGPIENLGGLKFSDDKGNTISWHRDSLERYRFIVDVPKGTRSLTIELDYICNQPSVNSIGVDSYGNSFIGALNWNTVVLYPESIATTDIEVTPSLVLPEKWKMACGIESKESGDDIWSLNTVSLSRLVDSPAIMGEHFRTFVLDAPNFPPTRLHVTSESKAALMAPDETIAKYGNVAAEAGILFGGGHFDAYDFLLYCSDQFPKNGLEHLDNSFNGVSERFFLDEKKLLGWEGMLLPHEFVHSWCGKFRRPAGMLTPDFHTAKDTRLLWVYEGLTQYLGDVLTVRSGIWSIDHIKQNLALNLSRYRAISGRQWRPLEDTAGDSYHLRGGSQSWSGLRRGQDYYTEGAFFWLEVDSILRKETDNAISLDDFAKQFLGAGYPRGETLPFKQEDVVTALKKLHDYDWKSLIDRRILQTQETLSVDFVENLGYKLAYSSRPSEALKLMEETYKTANALDSLGMGVNDQGKVGSNVVQGKPADLAGIAPGMKIIGINNRKFSLDRFREGIADSVVRGKVTFLVEDGDRFRTLDVVYDSGPRYLELVRDETKPDLIEAIYSAKLKRENN